MLIFVAGVGSIAFVIVIIGCDLGEPICNKIKGGVILGQLLAERRVIKLVQHDSIHHHARKQVDQHTRLWENEAREAHTTKVT
jgi:hypothetical protein